MVKITMANQGAEPHQAQLVKLNPGVTTQQFLAAAAQPDPSAAFALVTFTGGPNTIDKGHEQTVYDNLTAGNYLFLCFVSGDDNIPHFAKGMVKQLAGNPTFASGDIAATDGRLGHARGLQLQRSRFFEVRQDHA